MTSPHHEEMTQRALTAVLARLLDLKALGTGTRLTLASLQYWQGDSLFKQLMRNAAASGQNLLCALTEHRPDGTTARDLALVVTEGRVATAHPVEPARIAPGQPVILVSADRNHAWQVKADGLASVAVPSKRRTERGIDAVCGEIGGILGQCSAELASLAHFEIR